MVEPAGKKSSSRLPPVAKCVRGSEVSGDTDLPATENMRVNTEQGAGACKGECSTHASVVNYTQKDPLQLSEFRDKRLQKAVESSRRKFQRI